MNEKKLDERIKNILEDVKEGGLTKDSIAMILCLENEIYKLELEIDVAESTIRLIKDKKMFASYEGDRNNPYDVGLFMLTLKDTNNKNIRRNTEMEI